MKIPRAISVLLSLAMGVVLSGCGSSGGIPNSGAGGTSGGGTTSGGPSSILSGKYAFSFTGTATQTGAPVFLEGSFTADGNGNITSGIEDRNIVATIGGVATGQSITGTYTIGTDGRGTLNFTSLSQTFKIVIENSNHGQLSRFDSGAAGSGTFDLQTTSAFSLSALHQGSYVFDWNGTDTASNPFSVLGNVNLSGSTASGALDANDLNVSNGISQAIVNIALTAPDGNGHGTASIAVGSGTPITFSYGYVVVSANRILLIETDIKAGTVGEADAQTSGTLQPSGAYAFSLNGINQEFGLVGQIVAGTSGSITSSEVEENIQGSFSNGSFLPGSFTAADSIAGGSTVSNRFLLTATEPINMVTDNFVVYMISPSQAMIMEVDTDQLTFGQLLSQTGAPFSSASLNGNYGINFFGLDGNVIEGDFVGQFTSGGTSTLTAGTIDINDEDLSPPTIANNLISGGSYAIVNGATGHGTLSFTVAGGAFAFNFYFVSPNQILVLETDSLFIGLGSAQSQPTIP